MLLQTHKFNCFLHTSSLYNDTICDQFRISSACLLYFAPVTALTNLLRISLISYSFFANGDIAIHTLLLFAFIFSQQIRMRKISNEPSNADQTEICFPAMFATIVMSNCPEMFNNSHQRRKICFSCKGSNYGRRNVHKGAIGLLDHAIQLKN